MQTSPNFEQDITDAVIDQWHNQIRSHVHAGGPWSGGGHFKHMQ